MEIPDEITWKPGWLSWVAAVNACLGALGHEADDVDVAGHSGYAFALSIKAGLCPSGPTSLDWAALATGLNEIGRATITLTTGDSYTPELAADRTKAHAEAAFDLVRSEIDAGRPCVVWGLGVPEFGVAKGYDGDEYFAVGGTTVPERVRWDRIEAPGGPYVLAFPSEAVRRREADRSAIRRALALMTHPDESAASRCGPGAYELWVAELEAGSAVLFGNSYNVQCWAEARAFARDFLLRLVDRNRGVKTHLRTAQAAMAESAAALAALAELFPFTPDGGLVQDERAVREAVGHLQAARSADTEALAAMRDALEHWPAV